VVGTLTFVVALLPFDIWLYAPDSLAGIPGVSYIAGFLGLVSARAGDYPFLTANAFNAWALVGPIPLFSELSRTFIWAYDSLTLVGPLHAATLGAPRCWPSPSSRCPRACTSGTSSPFS
jgi:hypothetical protein